MEKMVLYDEDNITFSVIANPITEEKKCYYEDKDNNLKYAISASLDSEEVLDFRDKIIILQPTKLLNFMLMYCTSVKGGPTDADVAAFDGSVNVEYILIRDGQVADINDNVSMPYFNENMDCIKSNSVSKGFQYEKK